MEAYRRIIDSEPSSLDGTINVKFRQVLDKNTDDELEIRGFVESRCRLFLFYMGNILTLGITLLCFRWKPVWKLHFTCLPCTLNNSTFLLITDIHDEKGIAKVRQENSSLCNPQLNSNGYHEENFDVSITSISHMERNTNRYFVFRCLKYFWNNQDMSFHKLRGYDANTPCSDFIEKINGVTSAESTERLKVYGSNMIDIKVKSYGSLLIDEVLNPFYIFQIASMVLWSLDDYYYYASCIFIISLISIGLSLYETKKQMITLRNMVSNSNSLTVTIKRPDKDKVEEVSAGDLVPGDLLVIPQSGCLMCCDAVLTAGNCIVNESMLTGESVPETKTPLGTHEEGVIYCPTKEHKRNTLFCGTQIIQTRYYGNSLVTAVVVRTGFSTSKGELIRSILFPKPMGFTFYRDSMRFVLFLFCIATIGMAYSLYLYISRGSSVAQTLKKAFDIITIVVPPALPAALTVGIVYAQGRLKAKGIFCISPPRINLSGKLKLMAFDKTGTLTEDGLDLFGIVPVKGSKFQNLKRDTLDIPQKSRLLAAMSTCHSLTTIDGELSGDPLDLKMFQATDWVLEEPGKDTSRFDMLMPTVVRPCRQGFQLRNNGDSAQLIKAVCPLSSTGISSSFSSRKSDYVGISDVEDEEYEYEIGIVRQFPFSSSLQRMSVICRTLGAKNMDLYLKGAPEKVQSLCTPETVPSDFASVLKDYTLQGFRVLAFAHKELNPRIHWHQVQRLKRDNLECDLKFLGLLIMQNALKKETSPVIQTLRGARIRMIMITGDNLLTAVSVARDCSLIPSYSKVKVVRAVLDDTENCPWNTPKIIFEAAESDGNEPDVTHIGVYQAIHIERQRETHFVLDGKSFDLIRTKVPSLFKKVLVKGTVFARMSPDQKTHLVESLQSIGYVVGMCGDGANDCGALKASDVGISLSEAEASVAAPFTSRIPNIECVPIVMKEGRNALVTSFSIFKFIALYSIIQFISVLILYKSGANLGDPMFLYIDLAIITPLAIFMGYTKTYPNLVERRPVSNLMNIGNLTSMLLQAFLVIVFQASAIVLLGLQKWFVPNEVDLEIKLLCWESTTIFLSSTYQYLVVAVVFSKGPPYRKPFYTNCYYVWALIVLFGFNTLLTFSPWKVLENTFQLMNWHEKNHFNFRLTQFLLCLLHFVLAVAAELLVAQSDWLKRLSRIIRRKKVPKNEYKVIQSMESNSEGIQFVS